MRVQMATTERLRDELLLISRKQDELMDMMTKIRQRCIKGTYSATDLYDLEVGMFERLFKQGSNEMILLCLLGDSLRNMEEVS
jgi:short-subunit dehydrogenase